MADEKPPAPPKQPKLPIYDPKSTAVIDSLTTEEAIRLMAQAKVYELCVLLCTANFKNYRILIKLQHFKQLFGNEVYM